MQTPDQPGKQPDQDKKQSESNKPDEAPAGNESNNPLGDPNDVGTAGDYSR